MMPASAASTAPRRDDASQGWATTVAVGGRALAAAISRSYLACGAWWPAMLGLAADPASFLFAVSMAISDEVQLRAEVARLRDDFDGVGRCSAATSVSFVRVFRAVA